MSALPLKADIHRYWCDVRFVARSGREQVQQSGALDSLMRLNPNRPIREGDIALCFVPLGAAAMTLDPDTSVAPSRSFRNTGHCA